MSDNNNKTKVPTKFVGLHAHSTLSIGDGIGFPQEHIDYARENGADALALTDHGNMNGFSHQYFHSEKLKKQGINFKAIPGIEAYFVDSLEKWKEVYEENKAAKREETLAKKVEKEAKTSKSKKSSTDQEEVDSIGDEFTDTKVELSEYEERKLAKDDEEGESSAIENENETKTYNKFADPAKQRNHLVLLPKNREGLQALFKLTTQSFVDGYHIYPRMDFESIRKHAKGNLVATSACIGGRAAKVVFDNQTADYDKWGLETIHDNEEKIQQELKELADKFRWALGSDDSYYFEIQFNKLPKQHLVNYHLIEASKKFGIPLVTTCDSHYARPEQWKEREIYKLMAWSTKGLVDMATIPEKIEDLKCELYPKNVEQLWKTYQGLKDQYPFYQDDIVSKSIEQSWIIAHEQIDKDIINPDKKVKLPAIGLLIDDKKRLENYLTNEKFADEQGNADEDSVAFEELKKRSIDGLIWRKKDKEQKYIDQLKYELDTIKHLKISKYFLTYEKIMKELQKEMITGPGRGSGAGSLVCYVLSITQVDPLKYGLLFSRFLSKLKFGWPDIDSDSSDREKALDIITNYFGEKNVVAISNFNQLQLRSLIKDVARVYNLPFEEINKYTSLIESEARAVAKKTPGFDAQVWVLTYEVAEKDSPTFRKLLEENPEFANTIKVLFKQVKSQSRHAGGVLITNNAYDNMPLTRSKGVIQTPWTEGLNYRHLEGLGFLKFDILGLGTLRMFEETIRKIIANKKGINPKRVSFDEINKWYYDNVHPDNNMMDDINVYKNIYWEGKWAGIFQFVQPAAQNFIQKLKPRSILDIATATSIFRPGPLGAGVDKIYLDNRKNPKSIKYAHPLLEEVLNNTFGTVIFQEQLQLVYHKLAGMPLEETDAIRKAFTKKDISNKEKAAQDRQVLREDFLIRCKKTNNIPEQLSGQIFDDLEKYVSYSFNLAHAVSYAIVSYQCAWFMNYHPDEWISTYVDYCVTEKGKVSGKEDPKEVAIGEAKSVGYLIGKPDINYSESGYAVRRDGEDKILTPSFASLKYCGASVVYEITKNRPYKTLESLLLDPWSGQWRHSKFNKRAMETLCKLEALDSMELVGEGKKFKNYKQLHHVLVDNVDKIKRESAKKKATKESVQELIDSLVVEAQSIKDWTQKEKIANFRELAGNVGIELIITPDLQKYLKNHNIKSIDKIENDFDSYWGIVSTCKVAKTKTGKSYLKVQMRGELDSNTACFIWNYREGKDKPLPENTLVIGTFKRSDFGLAAQMGKLDVLYENPDEQEENE